MSSATQLFVNVDTSVDKRKAPSHGAYIYKCLSVYYIYIRIYWDVIILIG